MRLLKYVSRVDVDVDFEFVYVCPISFTVSVMLAANDRISAWRIFLTCLIHRFEGFHTLIKKKYRHVLHLFHPCKYRIFCHRLK